jgi:hypothetical protein
MADAPLFFLPAAAPERFEAAYAEMANWCHCAIPDFGKRIYSITFIDEDRGNEEWTATVGEVLRGIRRGRQLGRKSPLSDGATVQAIFSNPRFTVVTNYRIAPSIRSDWGNPFYVDKSTSITYFFAAHAPPKEFTE